MTEQRYFLTSKRSTATRRPVWVSPSTSDHYCGVCLRGKIEAKMGAACSVCGGVIVQEFVAVAGGAIRSAYAAIRTERRQHDARAGHTERTGNLLVMRAG